MSEADPKFGLMTEARIERAVADSPEAWRLQKDIFNAVRAYVDFLEELGVIWGNDEPFPRLKAQALVVTYDFGDGRNAVDISLKGWRAGPRLW
jgi:hypothetical protein